MKTQHIVRWRVKRRGGVVSDHTFRNFVFTAGYDLFSAYFQNTGAPSAIYLGLIAGLTGSFLYGDLEFQHTDDNGAVRWGESTSHLELVDPGVSYPPRQLWEPALSSWDDGSNEYGFELTGTVSYTVGDAGSGVAAVPDPGIRSGCFIVADVEDQFSGGDPLFAAAGAEIFNKDGSGGATQLFADDIIEITYTIRFQIEDTGI